MQGKHFIPRRNKDQVTHLTFITPDNTSNKIKLELFNVFKAIEDYLIDAEVI